MKLKTVTLRHFRSYKEPVTVSINDFTALIGKNDVGKSTIFEALEIFFNNKLTPIDSSDLNIDVDPDNAAVEITCVFDDFPSDIVLDATAPTTLLDEHLLNKNNLLQIKKIYNCSTKKPKESTFLVAQYPCNDDANDLILLKNPDLKKRCDKLEISPDSYSKTSNVSMRQAIFRHIPDLQLEEKDIPLDKSDDTKSIWQQIQKNLPIFALFQSDRPSKDDDSAVQDPMKIAVKEALKEVQDDLEQIKDIVRQKAVDLAEKTISKLHEMDPRLASHLVPDFKTEPSWDGLFKLTFCDDRNIPMNKRGSGVRRLILLNFFRAEAERRQQQEGVPSVIYAIEEPETSQHPDNQEMLVDALLELAQTESSQVLITTHVPALASRIPCQNLRYITCSDVVGQIIEHPPQTEAEEDIFCQKIADALGVLPETRVKVLICVEGPNDILFLQQISRILHSHDHSIPDLTDNSDIAFLPLGGSSLKQWVEKKYLKGLRKPEIHIYDADDQHNPPYKSQFDDINAAPDKNKAFLTSKRTMENYLHPDAITEVFEFSIVFSDWDNIPELVAREIHEKSESQNRWEELTQQVRKSKISAAKVRLNRDAASKMTYERIQQRDGIDEISGWLRHISSML